MKKLEIVRTEKGEFETRHLIGLRIDKNYAEHKGSVFIPKSKDQKATISSWCDIVGKFTFRRVPKEEAIELLAKIKRG
jgi:hypothetical protein|tara:strand:+ start:442 stop:675 length:234 start_codon:yes stop_codon:yes gene_type:complete